MIAQKRLAALSAALLLSTAGVQAAPYFNRIASFAVALNTPELEVGAEENSAEIITATEDGNMLVYSNALVGGVGFIDITDASAPKADGFVHLDGGPTSVAVIGEKVLVTVDTTEDFTAPTGYLSIIDITTREIEATCDLGGQPDAIAKNHDGSLIAISMENQRDEDVGDGGLPQLPSGNITFFDVAEGGTVDCGTLRVTELAGIADVAGEDAEPEYTDFNGANELAVTLQENNHIVIIDGETGEVTSDFSAGSVTLENIDATEDGRLSFSETQADRVREPDAVQWLDDDRIVIANEGDWNGGSRGFTIFSKDGTELYESGPSMEYIAAQLGHYPEGRSDAKGVEPEGMEVGTYGEDTLIFVNQERSSLVAIYKDTGADPEYIQSLPSGVGPEGALAIPDRNLYVTANETDLSVDGLAGAHVMIFERQDVDAPAYPQIMSDMDENGLPIGWAALSGAVATEPDKLFAVSDSAFVEAAIYEIDATASPARIVKKTVVTRDGAPAESLDLEGITSDGNGGFWLASEGDTEEDIPHGLVHVDADGAIIEEVAFPEALLAHEIRSASEGVTAIGTGDDMTLWIAIQREWKDDEKGFVKLVSYKPSTKEWGAVRYKLEAPTAGWVGLSEITVHGDHVYIIERDNQIAERATLKAIYRVPVSELVPAELGGDLPTVSKELVRDLIPDLAANNGYVVDKVESLAIDADGKAYVITDNDGVDDSSGETFFWTFNL
ncbi:esterase-like activity of phytase family protein [Devosia sediminis]|uniref:Esterase-like activity of phytase family protein n=1 Tax=Devosia sediminis TaxID=2798801 RepID=A0A934IVC4_9HYPH|nr:esterase-like activity of phytase family protein [Devosia sediminis]MBJ3783776.1 esterase-like activity of phytase family protein [Devosia sediminis]